MEDLFRQKPQTSFGHAGDQMPKNMLMKGEVADSKPKPDRKKMAHQQGIVAKARFIPVTDEDGSYEFPYTGIFESGAEHMIVRLSETGRIIPGVTKGLQPSVAFKFLRNGINSAN